MTITGLASTRPVQNTPPPADTGLLRAGARGQPVADLQTALNNAGFNAGPADGVFGRNTTRAVKDFQRANGLEADGVVGPRTREALGNARPAAERPAADTAQPRARADADTVRGTRQRAAAGDQTARDRAVATQQPSPGTEGVTSNRSAPTGATPSKDVTDRLNPENRNGRYWPRNGETYCNFFTQDFMRARGVPSRDFPPGMANDHNRWLNSSEARNRGWREVTGEEAQRHVNGGGVGVVSRLNPGGHGHIAPIIEGTTRDGAPAIANVGSRNFNQGHSTDSPAFRRAGTQFFIYDPR